MKALEVYYKKFLAGYLSRSELGEFEFVYSEEYLRSSLPAISITLPKQRDAFLSDDLFYFFDGLIPEGWLLNLAADKFKYDPLRDRFELLEKLCADCIGAVYIKSEEDDIDKLDNRELILDSGERKTSNLKKCLICYEKSEDIYHEECAKSVFGQVIDPHIYIDDKKLKVLAEKQLEHRSTTTGVQKKISLDLIKGEKGVRLTMTNLWGRFIFKPPGLAPHIPENEHLCVKLAELSGIKIEKSALIPMGEGRLGFIAARFDRGPNFEKYHQEDFCQILEKESYKKYNGSIEQIGKVLKVYSDFPGDNLYRLFELTIFNFLIGNVDAHLKNFSLSYENIDGQRMLLSPAYDLLSTDLYIKDNEQCALAINGKKNKLKESDFKVLCDSLALNEKVLDNILKKFKKLKPDWESFILKSFLCESDKKKFINLINKKFEIFE